jgi:hypothetical protein
MGLREKRGSDVEADSGGLNYKRLKVNILIRSLFLFRAAKEIRQFVVFPFVRQTGPCPARSDYTGAGTSCQKIGIGPVEKRGPDGSTRVNQPFHRNIGQQ